MRLCRPPPHHVTSASSNQCPCQKSNLVYDLRRVACFHYTSRKNGVPLSTRERRPMTNHSSSRVKIPRRGIEPRPTASKTVMRPPHSQGIKSVSRPGIEPGPGPSESPMQSATPSGQSRRLDSHQYGSAYRADAFLSRATSAISTSVRIRTPSSGFGNHPLSQEHTRVKLPGLSIPAALVIHPVPRSSTPH
jgi:hypothetical protein